MHLRTQGKCRKHEPQASVFKWPAWASSFALKYTKILHAQNNKTRFFYVLNSDKTGVFDQSECAQDPIYILINQ